MDLGDGAPLTVNQRAADYAQSVVYHRRQEDQYQNGTYELEQVAQIAPPALRALTASSRSGTIYLTAQHGYTSCLCSHETRP